MQRWNGWGDTTRDATVPTGLPVLLSRELGPGAPPSDARLPDVLRTVPASRLVAGGGLSTDPEDRLRHARGQSFPDLVALRSGQIGVVPDATALPTSAADVPGLLRRAEELDAVVVPYGGGTSVVGGVTTPVSARPVLTVDLRRLQRLERLDERSMLATFGAGVAGADLEAQLRAHGLTLGHYPQSFEQSTLGGWVATRSTGQQSLGFGRIEDLFAGGRLEAPGGRLDLPPFPASAAGPDLRQVVLGSEGRLGIVTEATVRVRRLPDVDVVSAGFLPGWEAGLDAARTLAQDSAGLSLVRLSTAPETATTLVLAGRAGDLLGRLLGARGLGPGSCLLLVGVMGTGRVAARARRRAAHVVRRRGGVWTGAPLGRAWQRQRFRQPYLRNRLWELGYGVDTMETATTWSRVPDLVSAVEGALHDALDEPVHVGTHLSHVYRSGSSVYTTVLFRLGGDHEQTLERWRRLKAAATRALVDAGGTVSHQHGVGLDHRDAAAQEKGPSGMAVLAAAVGALDPDGRMNPGKLLP
jgi:alkyldihydroxyacetonephosphate synthase